MVAEMCTDNELVEEITRNWNPASTRCGTLVQRFHGFWHYGVALSNTSVISWGPTKEAQVYYQGCLTIHELYPEFKDAVNVPYLSQDEIFKNLAASVFAFHRKWNYGVQGWNCEHWARLVVSGDPISYQVQEQAFGIFDIFGTLHRRDEAIEQLKNHRPI